MSAVRESNIELLRILAMFFVLICHALMRTHGLPSQEQIWSNLIPSYLYVFLSSIAMGGVNIFILISGWYGIRFNKKGIFKIIFEVLFLLWLIFLFFFLKGDEDLTLQNLKLSLGLSSGYWFVMGYLGMYILSPILN